jgi:hypothetical protein
VYTKLDNLITGFNTYNSIFTNIELSIGDSNNIEILVFNMDNGILYKHFMGNFFGQRDINISGGLTIQNAEPRIIQHKNGETSKITLLNYGLFGKSSSAKYYDSRTKERIILNDILNHSGDFQNFYPGQQKEALEYVRERLNNFSTQSSEIWIWDPFLRHNDILETLYYVEMIGIPMKCITSFRKIKSHKEEYKNYTTFKNKEKKKFLKHKNIGINLEFRAVYNDIGFSFHDRFLFFIPNEADKIPKVYSLGTSINNLGTTHHLIMQTVYPRNIVIAFQELWQKLLNDEGTLIIKLPEEK